MYLRKSSAKRTARLVPGRPVLRPIQLAVWKVVLIIRTVVVIVNTASLLQSISFYLATYFWGRCCYFLSFLSTQGIWSSWARDPIQASVETCASAAATLDPLTHPAGPGIEPVSLALQRRHRSFWATVGTPSAVISRLSYGRV